MLIFFTEKIAFLRSRCCCRNPKSSDSGDFVLFSVAATLNDGIDSESPNLATFLPVDNSGLDLLTQNDVLKTQLLFR